tara:strand:+ start:52 stop:318 length:267 start_codon:yes stop_codon:yes gene_type:complete
MQTRIKKTTTVEGRVKFQPQWRKAWYSKWYGFYICTNIATNDDYEILNSYPYKYLSDSVLKLEMAKEVIDNFLKNPVTEDKVEYIKYP